MKNQKLRLKIWKRKGDKETESRESIKGQAGVRAETRRVTSGSRGAPRGREQVGGKENSRDKKGRGGRRAVSAQ